MRCLTSNTCVAGIRKVTAIPPRIRSSLPQALGDFLDRLECCLDVWDLCCRVLLLFIWHISKEENSSANQTTKNRTTKNRKPARGRGRTLQEGRGQEGGKPEHTKREVQAALADFSGNLDHLKEIASEQQLPVSLMRIFDKKGAQPDQCWQ